MAHIPLDALKSTLVEDILSSSPYYKPVSQDPKGDFLSELGAAGFKAKPPIVVGKLTRIDAPDDKSGQMTGWYVYNEFDDRHNDGHVFGVGVYGSWRGNPERVTWTSKATGYMSSAERSDYHIQLEHAKAARDAEQQAVHREASERALSIYGQSLLSVDSDNGYLVRKKIKPVDGVRQSRDSLVIPVCTPDAIASLQFIKPNGEKRFLTGGRKKGCFFIVSGSTPVIYVAEGYATAVSIHMATGATVYVSFDAGNLYEVASHVKNKHGSKSRVVIAGDDDKFSQGNTGRAKAVQASSALGLECVFPVFSNEDSKPTDWNDLHCLEGIKAVKSQLMPSMEGIKLYKSKEFVEASEEAASDLMSPIGVLGEITSYYHATSGNAQPAFAVQSAIAVCSVICARSFTTNYSNRTSLYLLNVGKSGTGKEHAKRVIENVLEACSLGHLINGDGYTAGSSVVSALMARPRHITVIDEFNKYMRAAQNKNSSHLMEANSQIMQVFGRVDGTVRPRSYSTIGLQKDKRKDLENMKVVNPAITILGMGTPDELFKAIDMTSIQDGFLNRFLVCESHAERSTRIHKEHLDVPQSIIEWSAKITTRRGLVNDDCSEKPDLVTVTFSEDSLKEQRQFEEWCIEKANSLEKFGLSEIPMRGNEISMRLALIHALSRDPDAEYITREDVMWSTSWVKNSLEGLINKLKMSVSGSEYEGMKKAALLAIRSAGSNGFSYASMQKEKPFSTFREKDLKEILNALEEADLVIKDTSKTGKRGRPSTVYYAVE